MSSIRPLREYNQGLRTAFAVENGNSIASEGKGDYMFVEGRVLSVDGTPIPNATIETWETDGNGTPADASKPVPIHS